MRKSARGGGEREAGNDDILSIRRPILARPFCCLSYLKVFRDYNSGNRKAGRIAANCVRYEAELRKVSLDTDFRSAIPIPAQFPKGAPVTGLPTSPAEGAGLPGERFLAVKVVMMPRDTNPVGTIFGGVLLSYIDQAGVVGAQALIRDRQWPAPTLVTVAMNGVEFHQPVFVGDVVSFWTRALRIGRTSITVHVAVETDRAGQTIRLTKAEVVYVAVDAERRPVAIKP